MAAFANAMLTFYPAIWWLIAAFRPATREIGLTYLLNDGAWLQFVGAYSITVPMFIAPAILAFCGMGTRPFPRWFGFYSLFVCVVILPDQAVFFFYDGPFAWNGLISVYIPLILFATWFFVTSVLLHKYANWEHRDR